MFVCYQDEKPCYVVDTLDAVDAIPSVVFTRVEEVEFAVLYNDKVYLSEEDLYNAQVKYIESIRASLYNKEVDTLMSEYNRKKLFNLFNEEEEEALLAKIETKVAKIKEENPYPIPKEVGLLNKEEEIEENVEEITQNSTIL